jgi:hypothetical protein
VGAAVGEQDDDGVAVGDDHETLAASFSQGGIVTLRDLLTVPRPSDYLIESQVVR